MNSNFEYLFEQLGHINNIRDRMTEIDRNTSRLEHKVDNFEGITDEARGILNQAQDVISENTDVKRILEGLIIESGNPNAEVSAARNGYDLIGQRLDADAERVNGIPNILPEYTGNISSKVIERVTEHDYRVYSKKPTGEGYIMMRFRDDQSVNGSGDAGDPGDLMRLVNVREVDVANVYQHEYTRGSDNLRETVVFTDGLRNDVWVNDLNGTVRAGDFIEYDVTVTADNLETEIALITSSQSDPNAKLIVDGEQIDTLDLSEPSSGINNIVRYKIFFSSTGTHTIRVESAQNAMRFYVLGVNYGNIHRLSKEREYDTFQSRETDAPYITNVGANDYAMRDEDDFKLAGSYHGGEGRVSLEWIADNEVLNLPVGESKVVKNLRLEQVTDLRGKLTSETITDLSYDGVYSFTAHLYGAMTVSTLYINMTCTHTDFSDVVFPKRWSVPVSDSVNDYEINRSHEVIQRNPNTLQTVTTKLTTLTNNPPSENSFIRHASGGNFPYNKHYHAYTHEDIETIRDITFRSIKIFD